MTLKLCGGADGQTLVATPDGKLVLGYAQATGVQVQVTAHNPACGTRGSGWYSAWNVKMGNGNGVNGGRAQSSGGAASSGGTTYANGTIDNANPACVVLLQLMAWSGTDEYKPDNEKLRNRKKINYL